MSELAILGGSPVRTHPFPAYRIFGEEEKSAVAEVMDSAVLSRFLGAWHPDFFGGPKVQEFEKAWASAYDSDHAVSVNSATSGLYAAIGAAGVGPGDEVIVTPWSMSASATAPLIFNAVPVFADIDPETYTLAPDSIRARITSRTKAILVVHIFGHPADMDPIMAIAAEHGLTVIEDCAQIPCTSYKGRPVGTLGHMGVFSLNYHKHIHTGEGGVVTTNDADLAMKLRLIRNHAEAVLAGKGHDGPDSLVNMIGFNYRLGELEAAIGLCQLAKGPELLRRRRDNVRVLEGLLQGLPGLTMPKVAAGCDHAYYVHVLDYDAAVTGVSRDRFVAALRAELPVTELREGEGPLVRAGYVKPLYNLPLFQSKIGYGSTGCPFSCPHYGGSVDYSAAAYPNVETAQQRVILHELMRPGMEREDLEAVAAAFHKVYTHLDALKED